MNVDNYHGREKDTENSPINQIKTLTCSTQKKKDYKAQNKLRLVVPKMYIRNKNQPFSHKKWELMENKQTLDTYSGPNTLAMQLLNNVNKCIFQVLYQFPMYNQILLLCLLSNFLHLFSVYIEGTTWCLHRVQKTTCGNQFCPSMVWVLELDLRLSVLAARSFIH